MSTLHFKNTAAAEMLTHMHPHARISLQLESADKGIAVVRLMVTIDNKEIMRSDETSYMHVGDRIAVPQELSVKITTA